MSDNNPPPASQLTPDEKDKLRELTTQSWNLELAISGVAMFAILQLPDLLESAFSYLRYNYMTHTEGVAAMLPSLAYSLMRATCHVLFAAFLANFVMRAFWVGLVGLLAVFPSGIHYDRIPFSTPYAQQRLANELGPLDRYILWLDKRCNIVFALAFQFVFLLIVVAILYMLGLLIYLVVQPNVSANVWFGVKIALGVLVAVFYVAIFWLNQKKVKATPRGMQLNYRFTKVGQLVMLGMYKHTSYVTNTFYSNIRPGKLLQTAALFILVFFAVFFFEYANDISRTNGRTSLLNSRHIYSARVDSLYVEPTAYDNQRPEGAFISGASIQSDVIREPYLRLFIAYPKALDMLLKQVAPEPAWSDTLSRQARRQQYAIWSSQQINRLIRITVNDSVCTHPDLLFTQTGIQEQRGWQTVLVPGNLKLGRNRLRVALQDPREKEDDELITIPFWYVPEP
ncbi:ABC transporter ATP-binding protein [Spirosoma agri]|uniref:ABC transporter ATP-binding protein n=1 Tax=Spirosoma agri TaxID=1987381 RepID=A0A6M0IMP9_9BACT|nr:ABC transporter ATP-binding protein [Spirosoma agri]NEU69528.1 ABC transporter ATP-binding protein [Spirosoma agri]